MSTIPAYWKTRMEDIEETLKLVKKGTVTQPTVSAGGRPIYCVEYGRSNLALGKANLSSALGGGSIQAYADKSGADYIPTVFLCGCVHGGEFEGTSAVLNLIKLIETGTDYAGTPNELLAGLAEKVHLILVPMVNPDGRSHIPFDSFVDKTFYDLRYYNQGTWKDGTLCGWPGCKLIHPIKDVVDYLGGYFNDDGINLMHEDFIGGKISNETQLILDICKQEAPDMSILLHGGTNSPNHILAPIYSSLNTKKLVFELGEAVAKCHLEEDIPYMHLPVQHHEDNENPPSFNLLSAMHHCCGEPAITFESNQGLIQYAPDEPQCTYEEIYRSLIILFTESMRHVLQRYNKL